jgi:hypothetical protein
MVFLNFVALGVIVGLVLGGSLSALADIDLRALRLVFVAIGLQVLAFPSGVLPWALPELASRGLWLASYTLLVGFLVGNRSFTGIRIAAAGVGCNLVAVLANGGLMPALPSALRGAGRHYDLHNNSITRARPSVSWLVDRWATPHWLPFGNVFSVGDVLIALGAAAVVVAAMLGPLLAKRPGVAPVGAAE